MATSPTIPGGAVVEAMLIGMIVLHELAGPSRPAVALHLSGERGARDAATGELAQEG